MSNLGEIKAAILRRLQDANGVSLSPLDVTLAINEAINHYKDQVFKFNYVQDTDVIAAGTNIIPIPSNYLSPVSKNGAFVVEDNLSTYPLGYITPLDYNELYSQSTLGRPLYFSFVNDGYICWPTSDLAYVVKRYYIVDVPVLVNDADSNLFTVNAATMVRNYALGALSMELTQDEKMATYYFEKAQSDFDKFVKQNNDSISTGYSKQHTRLY